MSDRPDDAASAPNGAAATCPSMMPSPTSDSPHSPSCAGSSVGASCTANAFTTLFQMARANACRSSSPAPSQSSSRSAPAAPQLASIERGRSIAQKKPAEQRKAVAGKHKRVETSISLEARTKQYKGEMLVVSKGELTCSACKCTLQNIKSTIDAHVASNRHKEAVERAQQRVGADHDLHSELMSYYLEHPEEKGSSTAPEVQVYRFLVVQSFLAAGIPLAKVDDLRGLLERYGHPLTAVTNLRQLVPKVEAREMSRLLGELEGQYLSMAFDGTTRLGEAINVVGRYCSPDFMIHRRLLRFLTLAEHADAAAISGVIVNLVVGQLHIPLDRVVAWLHDSAAVNGAAVHVRDVLICDGRHVRGTHTEQHWW